MEHPIISVKDQCANKPTVPGEWSGGEHIRTTPWPSRTETALLVRPLKFPRSIERTERYSYIPTILNFVATVTYVLFPLVKLTVTF